MSPASAHAEHQHSRPLLQPCLQLDFPAERPNSPVLSLCTGLDLLNSDAEILEGKGGPEAKVNFSELKTSLNTCNGYTVQGAEDK
jgi:hypothetical protein